MRAFRRPCRLGKLPRPIPALEGMGGHEQAVATVILWNVSVNRGFRDSHWGVGHPSPDPPEPITEVGVTAASSGACTTDTAASGSEALEPWPQPAGAGGLA